MITNPRGTTVVTLMTRSRAMRDERQPYSEILRFRAPPGLGDAIACAAARDFGSSSEFVRRVLVERLRLLGIDPNSKERSPEMHASHHAAGGQQ